MKQFLLIILCCSTMSASAQVDTVRLKNKTTNAIVTDRPPQAVYFQLFGAGPILSAIYDRRFGNRPDGFGFAVGLGYYRDFFIDMFSFPMSLNYLIGKQNHFLEIATGTTFITAKTDNLFSSEPNQGAGFIHHFQIGYRKQPTLGGFFFRGGMGVWFVPGNGVIVPHLGFGYNF